MPFLSKSSSFQWCLVGVIVVSYAMAGCGPKDEPSKEHAKGESGHEHADEHHDHDHEHGEAGPHGGHILDLRAGDQLIHAEWTHDDKTGLVAVYLLDPKSNQPVDSGPESIEIEIRTGKANKKYSLPLVTTILDAPVKSAYSIEDVALVTALQIVVEHSEPVLRATVGGTRFEAKFETHDHAH